MDWAKFDDRRHTNGKLIVAGLAANGLDANGITYAAANETDGFIEDSVLTLLAPNMTPRRRNEVVGQLIGVGRWTRDDDRHGWWIHDYLTYNPSRADLEKKRAEERDRKQRQRRDPSGQFQADSGRSPAGRGAESERSPTVPDRTRPDPYNPPSSTSNSRSPAERADDEQRVHATLKAITDRRIADHATGPIPNMAGYRRAVAAGVTKDFKPSAYLLAHQHPDWPPERLAVTLDPPDKPKLAVVQATENTRLGGIAQWLAEGTGA